MPCAMDLGAEAEVGLYQPIRGTGPICVHMCVDTLADEDSGSGAAPTELDVSSDENEARIKKSMHCLS